MSRQSSPTLKTCQHPSVCENWATLGLFRWRPGDTDVDLNKPVRVYCGRHKPLPSPNHRLVKLKT
jgi:hypothetical protein